MTDPSRMHLFVSDGAVRGQQIALQGEEAARAFQKGLRSGMSFTALDGSVWALDVEVVESGPGLC